MKEKILNEIVNNTLELMNYVTIKENYSEFDKAFDYIKKELKNYNIVEKKIDNYNNLIIANTKSKNFDIIFCCHIDVVMSDNYKGTVKEGKIYGRGSFDMKGQLSTIISLLKNNTTDKKIALIITSDEEIGGNCCKEIMEEYNSSLAVVPDGGKNFRLVVEEKGLLQVQIESYGKMAHASEPYKGENAILKNIDIYNKLTKKYKVQKDEKDFKMTINLSKIEGGSSINAVADKSNMILDIRYTKETTIDKILNDIKTISPKSKITVLDSGPDFSVDTDNELIKEFLKNSKKILKTNMEITKCNATSDAIYFSQKNIPVIIVNPCGGYWHSPKEYAVIESYYKLYLILKTLI